MPYTPPTREQLTGTAEAIAKQMREGCGNRGCIINPPKGQATNACCTCHPRQIASRLLRLAVEIEGRDIHWNLAVKP